MAKREIILGVPNLDVVFCAETRVLEFHAPSLGPRLAVPPPSQALYTCTGDTAVHAAAALWIAHRRMRSLDLLREWFGSAERAVMSSHGAEVSRWYRCGRVMLQRAA